MNRDQLEGALTELLEPMGVRAVGADHKVTVDSARDCMRIRLVMPVRYIDVEIDRDELVSGREIRIIDKIEWSARALFADVVEHIAKHDRSPVDRMRDIETTAAALLDAMRVHLDDIRMPHGASSAVLNAAYQLRWLLEHKPGSPAWGSRGYGAEAPASTVVPT